MLCSTQVGDKGMYVYTIADSRFHLGRKIRAITMAACASFFNAYMLRYPGPYRKRNIYALTGLIRDTCYLLQ